jgi:hypothetical protein
MIVVCAVAVAATGCGSSDPASSQALAVHVDFSRSAHDDLHVTCEDAGDCTPDGVRGAQLRTLLTEPVPKHQACTMIFGGPQTAVVTGTVGSRAVKVRFSRENGCAIHRYGRLLAALGLPARRP